MSKFKQLGACWKNEKEGYSCKLSVDLPANTRFQIFKNKYKKGEKQPDLIIGMFEDKEE